jgi:hypothetical protein
MGDKYVEKRFVGHGTQLSCMKRVMLKIGSGGSNEERNILSRVFDIRTAPRGISEICWKVLILTSCRQP